MTTDAEIIREYEANERENERLGLNWSDRALIEETAYELDVPEVRVADVMLAHWAGQGAG